MHVIESSLLRCMRRRAQGKTELVLREEVVLESRDPHLHMRAQWNTIGYQGAWS